MLAMVFLGQFPDPNDHPQGAVVELCPTLVPKGTCVNGARGFFLRAVVAAHTGCSRTITMLAPRGKISSVPHRDVSTKPSGVILIVKL